MARKLSDAEFTERTRAANRRRTERYQQRLAAAGKVAVTLWIPESIRTALTAKAANDGATIADTAALLLSAALTHSTIVESTTPTLNPAERNERIKALHLQGLSGREIARQVGCGKTTVFDVLKRMETHQ